LVSAGESAAFARFFLDHGSLLRHHFSSRHRDDQEGRRTAAFCSAAVSAGEVEAFRSAKRVNEIMTPNAHAAGKLPHV
jgi:hypothetical protein